MNAYQKKNLGDRKSFLKVIPGHFTLNSFKREIYAPKEILFWEEGRWQFGEHIEPYTVVGSIRPVYCLDDIARVFGCKSRARALTVYSKCLAFIDRNISMRSSYRTQIEEFGYMCENGKEYPARINLMSACCKAIVEMVKLKDARDYAIHLHGDEEYDFANCYDDIDKRKNICKEIVILRHKLIAEQRCVRDRLSALKDLRKQLKKNNRNSEYSRRQLNALGIIA